MMRTFGLGAIGLMFAVVCAATTGCATGKGCSDGSCSASRSPAGSYSDQSYVEPTYSSSGGSGSRSAPAMQGSGSR